MVELGLDSLPKPYRDVFAELTDRRRSDRETRLVAFADPAYPHDGSIELASGTLRHMREDLKRLVPLSATRNEAREIGALWPNRSVLWLGEEATAIASGGADAAATEGLGAGAFDGESGQGANSSGGWS